MSDSPEKVAWVTGGSGFLARHVSRHLAASGYSVAALGRRAWRDPAEWGVKWWLQQTVTHDGLEELRQRSGMPSVVFHGAGTGTVGRASEAPQEAFADTVASTEVVTEFLGKAAPGSKLIYPSSCAVYGAEAPRPTPETAERSPSSQYGEYKVQAEDICDVASREFGLRIAIIRFFSLYGVGLRKQFLWDFSRKAFQTAPGSTIELEGTGEETRDFMHVEDAARLILECSEQIASRNRPPEPLVVNGGTGRSTSVAEAANLLLNVINPSISLRFTGRKRSGDPEHYLASVKKLRSLGFEPRWVLETGVKQVAVWAETTLK